MSANHGPGTPLISYAVKETAKRSGLCINAAKAKRAKLAALQAEEQLQRLRLVQEWAQIVDALPCRHPNRQRFIGESNGAVMVEMTWAVHHARNERSLCGQSKDAKVLKVLRLQKEVVTRLLGRTCLEDRGGHWSELPWLKWPEWLQQSVARHDNSRLDNNGSKHDHDHPSQISHWSELESDDDDDEDWLDYHEYPHEDPEEDFVPEPVGHIASQEREKFLVALSMYYQSIFKDVHAWAWGCRCAHETCTMRNGPVFTEGFGIQLRVRVPKQTVHRLLPQQLRHELQSASQESTDAWLQRALLGLRSAALVAFKSSKGGFWPALHRTICDFLPKCQDVNTCLQGLEAYWEARNRQTQDLLLSLSAK
jgi:hypothetical protein